MAQIPLASNQNTPDHPKLPYPTIMACSVCCICSSCKPQHLEKMMRLESFNLSPVSMLSFVVAVLGQSLRMSHNKYHSGSCIVTTINDTTTTSFWSSTSNSMGSGSGGIPAPVRHFSQSTESKYVLNLWCVHCPYIVLAELTSIT